MMQRIMFIAVLLPSVHISEAQTPDGYVELGGSSSRDSGWYVSMQQLVATPRWKEWQEPPPLAPAEAYKIALEKVTSKGVKNAVLERMTFRKFGYDGGRWCYNVFFDINADPHFRSHQADRHMVVLMDGTLIEAKPRANLLKGVKR